MGEVVSRQRLRTMGVMEIAGLSVRDSYLLELATMLRTLGSDTTAERLADSILDDKPRINLSVAALPRRRHHRNRAHRKFTLGVPESCRHRAQPFGTVESVASTDSDYAAPGCGTRSESPRQSAPMSQRPDRTDQFAVPAILLRRGGYVWCRRLRGAQTPYLRRHGSTLVLT